MPKQPNSRNRKSALAIPARGDWTFQSKNVAANFDAHVNEQLPWYRLATSAVAHVARHYIPTGGLVYDIGASTGNIGRSLKATIRERKVRFVGVEESAEMVAAYRGPGEIICARAQEYEFEPFDFAVLFLVLMFVPVAERAGLLTRLRSKVRPGGAIVVFDKMTAPDGYVGTILRRLTMCWKLENGASAEDIVAKELSLSGVQRPLHRSALPPEAVEFFTFGEFAGFIIEGPES